MPPGKKPKLIIELLSLRKSDQGRIDSLIEKVEEFSGNLLVSNEASPYDYRNEY